MNNVNLFFSAITAKNLLAGLLMEEVSWRKDNLLWLRIRKEKVKKVNNPLKWVIKAACALVDYDLQAAMLEAIYRMTVASQRREYVHSWFTMDFVASDFLKIREPQFETVRSPLSTSDWLCDNQEHVLPVNAHCVNIIYLFGFCLIFQDCRKFLNMVNGMKGDRRRYLTSAVHMHLREHWATFLTASWDNFCLVWQSVFLPMSGGVFGQAWGVSLLKILCCKSWE